MAYGDSSTIQDLNAVAFNHIISDPKILNAKMRGRPALAVLLGLANAKGYRTDELRKSFQFDKLKNVDGANIEVTMFAGTATYRDLTMATASDVTPVDVVSKPFNVTLPWREVIGNKDVPGQYMRHARGDKKKIENVMTLFGTQLVQGWLEKLHTELMGSGLSTTTALGGLYGLISDGTSTGETGFNMYGQLNKAAAGNEDFQSYVVNSAGAWSRTKVAQWQQTLRDRGGNASLGIMNSAEHALLQVQYDDKIVKDEYSDLMSKIGAPYFWDNGTLFIPDPKAPAGTLLLFDPEDFFFRGKGYDAMPDQPKELENEVTFVHLQNNEDLWRGKAIYSLQTGAHGNAFKNSGKIKGLTFA